MQQTTQTQNKNLQPLIKVEDLLIGFGSKQQAKQTVHGVSFEVYPGECLAIVGESGSGKSVTARTLIGLTGTGAQIQAKTLELNGQDLRGASERTWRTVRGAQIGYVLQDALVSLDPLRTIDRKFQTHCASIPSFPQRSAPLRYLNC